MDDGRIWKWGSGGEADIQQATDRPTDIAWISPRCRHVGELPQHSWRVRILGPFIRALSLRQKQGTGEIAEVTPSLTAKSNPLLSCMLSLPLFLRALSLWADELKGFL